MHAVSMRPGQLRMWYALGAAEVSSFERISDELAKNWRPSGFYTPAQVLAVIDKMAEVFAQADKPLQAYLSGSYNYKPTINMVRSRLSSTYARGITYLNAVKVAQAKGLTIIDAPGLKKWVIDTFNAAATSSDALRLMADIKPAIVSILETVYDVMQAAYDFIRKVVGVAADVVRAAGSAVLAIPDTVGTIIKVATWGGVALVAWWGYTKWKGGS